jgi:DNA-binding SARP family transcriptional activator/tetratricopeptide (TPR) repeat protein
MYRLQTLGRLVMTENGQSAKGVRPRDLLLLAYLDAKGIPCPRQQIAGMFWPSSPEGLARHSLSQSLYRLNHRNGPRVVIGSSASVQINRAYVSSDIQRVHRSLQRGRFGASAIRAISNYLGNLQVDVPHPVQMWADGYRAKLSNLAARHLELAIETLLQRGRYRQLDKLIASATHLAVPPELQRAFTMVASLNRATSIHDRDVIIHEAQTLCAPAKASFARLSAWCQSMRVESTQIHNFVGRSAELKALAAADALGRFAHWIIRGEAGIGKTALAEEYARWATAQGASCYFVKCFPAEKNLGLAPIIGLMHELAQPLGSTAGRQSLVDDGADSGASNAGICKLPFINGALDWTMFCESIAQDVRSGAPGRKVIIVDDVQWADTSSVGILHYLARNINGTTAQFIMIERHPASGDETAYSDELRNTFKVLQLGRLSRSDAERLARTSLSRIARRIPSDAVRRTVRSSGGNPLILLTLCGDDHVGTPGARTKQTRRERRAAVLFQRLVRSRIEGLSERARVMLDILVVFGRPLQLDSWRMIVGDQSARFEIHVESLLRMDLIKREGGTISVTHGLIRDAIYSFFSPAYKRALHRSIALRLGARSGSAVLAYHCAHAGMPSEAVRHAIKGARTCRRRSAYAAAAELYLLAAGLVKSRLQAAKLNLRAAKCLVESRQWRKASGVLEEAIIKCPEHGALRVRMEVLAFYTAARCGNPRGRRASVPFEVLINDPRVRESAYLQLQLHSAAAIRAVDVGAGYTMPPFTTIENLGQQCGRLSEAIPALADYCGAICVLRSTKVGLAAAAKLLELTERAADTRARLVVYPLYACMLMMSGQLGQADGWFLKYRQLLSNGATREPTPAYWNNRGVLLCEQGRFAEARRYLRRAVTMCRRSGSASLYTKALENLAILRWEEQGAEGAREFDHAVAIRRMGPCTPLALFAIAGLAALSEGRLAQAKRCAEEITAHLAAADRTIGDRAYAEILVARVLKRYGEKTAAIERLEIAAEARAPINRLDAMRMQLEYARHILPRDAKRAANVASDVVRAARSGGALLLEQQASQLLCLMPG